MLILTSTRVTCLLPRISLARLCSSNKSSESSTDDLDSDTRQSSDPVSSQSVPISPLGRNSRLNRPFPSRSRFGRNLSPSQRLGNLLPEDYWKSQDQTVVESVEFLQKPLTPTAEKGKSISQVDEQKHQLEPFEYGKTILISVLKKYLPLEPYKRFTRAIQDEGEQILSLYSFGSVHAQDVIGKRPPLQLKSSNGNDLLLTHPSMEEYLECLQKLPVTLTPKVAMRVLCNMIVGAGDKVFEAGSGSGHMSLMLSKQVGSSGRVDSFDMVKDHTMLAERNVRTATQTFADFPHNVNFNIAEIGAVNLEAMCDFMYLDLPSLVRVPSSIIQHLSPGKTLCFVAPSPNVKCDYLLPYKGRQREDWAFGEQFLQWTQSTEKVLDFTTKTVDISRLIAQAQTICIHGFQETFSGLAT